jgi:RND superfamily putative drug exporter
VGLWLAAFVGLAAIGGMVGGDYDGELEPPPSESARGFATLTEYFSGAASSYGGSIVYETPDGVGSPEIVEAMSAFFARVDAIDQVAVVDPYGPAGAGQISPDGTVAFAQLNLSANLDKNTAGEIRETITAMMPTVDGLRIEIGGRVFAALEPPESEMIGLAFAMVVLILAFGSVMAMGLPIAVALAGVGTAVLGVVALLAEVMPVPEISPLIGVMIGLGVGIDYALFIVTRYRELTRDGLEPEEATAKAVDTAGRAVVFAGSTVVVSLLGMLLIGLPFIAGLGVACAATVAITMVASLTLLPALIGLTHDRMEVTRWRGLIASGFAALGLLGIGFQSAVLAVAGFWMAALTMAASLVLEPLRRRVPERRRRPTRETFAYRWSRAIQARPWTFVVVGTMLLGAMSAPVLGLRLGFSDEGNFAAETTTRQAYDLMADGFGAGSNGPFLLAFELPDPGASDEVAELVRQVASDPGVAAVAPPIFDDPDSPDAALVRILPTTAPQDEVTASTVNRLRSELIEPFEETTGIEANLTGAVPTDIDYTDHLSRRMPVFFAVVLGVSFLLLTVVFRSLLVPLKAVAMNVLSISAAYGVLVAVFQWGWLGSITGVEAAPIEPFIPMMLFAIVFGLSMDYEVFLLSRIKEEHDRTGDPTSSVADGLAATGRVISAAAAIMVVVFGSAVLEDDRIVKMFGLGLGLAVLVDATLVRMLLVPATMELLGERNWWLPSWMEKVVPRVSIEGAGHVPAPRHAREPGTPPPRPILPAPGRPHRHGLEPRLPRVREPVGA